jgi:hypothetical protein
MLHVFRHSRIRCIKGKWVDTGEWWYAAKWGEYTEVHGHCPLEAAASALEWAVKATKGKASK